MLINNSTNVCRNDDDDDDDDDDDEKEKIHFDYYSL